jgi:nitrogen fixation/metabolism regulation signal transduction histidine kinase
MPKPNQRKVANIIKTAGLSKGYYINVFAGGAAFLGILMYYASRQLSEVNVALASLPESALSAGLQDRVYTIAILFFVCFLVFLVSTVTYMVVLGHRVGGPIVAIVATIQQMKKGNYEIQRELRKNDELGDIMNELHELAEVLKKKT